MAQLNSVRRDVTGDMGCNKWLVLAAVFLQLSTWGCAATGDPVLAGVYDTWDEVVDRWIGKHQTDLFLELGPPQFHKEADNGMEELVWDMTLSSMPGQAEIYGTLPLYGGGDCRLIFIADAEGIVRSGKREGCD